MKRQFVFLLLGAVLLMLVGSATAQYGNPSKIVNSKHDLSNASIGATVKAGAATDLLGQICAYCHVAHQASGANKQAPLWNHSITSTNFAAKYGDGANGSSTFNALGTGITALGAGVAGSATASHLCLSCHDGTVAINSLYKNVGPAPSGFANIASHTDASGFLTSTANIGTDLSDDHPVNFKVDQTSWIGLTNPNVQTSATASVGKNFQLPLFGGAGNYKMQCATCHDVHDPAVFGGASRYFLRNNGSDPLAGSTLCLNCHTN